MSELGNNKNFDLTDVTDFFKEIDNEYANIKEISNDQLTDTDNNVTLDNFDKLAYYNELENELNEYMSEFNPKKDYTAKSFADKDDDNAIELLRESLTLITEMKYDEAITKLNEALTMDVTKPLYKILYEQLEICYRKAGSFENAEECLKYLFALEESFYVISDLIDVYNLTGNKLKKFELREKIKEIEAETPVKKLMVVDLLIKVKDYEGAITFCKEIIEEDPDNIFYCRKLFDVYIDKEDIEEAYKFAMDIVDMGKEDDFLFQLFMLYNKMFDAERAFKYMKRCLKEKSQQTDWLYTSYRNLALVTSTYDNVFNDEEYTELIKQNYEATKQPVVNSFDIDTSYFRDINVGFISYDLCTHPVGYFILALFEDKRSFSGLKTFCYYTRPVVNDNITKSIEKAADAFRNVSNLGDEETSKIILNDKLDILIDLNGNTVGTKIGLFIKRLAPVQITWMGFPSSTFIPNVDYLIGDHYTDPIGVTERFLTEKPLRMSKTYLCYPLAFNEKIEDLPYLKNGYITFACLNGAVKLSNKSLRLWAEILERVPGSKLLLRNNVMYKDFLFKHLKKRIEENGIDLDRVIFEKSTGFADYLRSYNQVDILLDTYPYNGVTTTCEAFYMGVPLVSLRGNRRHTRCAYSLLTNVGLGNLCADTDEGYIETAVNLANDIDRLKHIRETLREDTFNSPLCDTISFKPEFENMLRRVYFDYCNEHKKEFVFEYDSWDELVKPIILSLDFISFLIADNEAEGRLKPLISELSVLLESLIVELEAAYADNENITRLIKPLKDMITLLPDVSDCDAIATLLGGLKKYILSIV